MKPISTSEPVHAGAVPASSAAGWHKGLMALTWGAALVILLGIFMAYQQPDLVLNFLGLRYCG